MQFSDEDYNEGSIGGPVSWERTVGEDYGALDLLDEGLAVVGRFCLFLFFGGGLCVFLDVLAVLYRFVFLLVSFFGACSALLFVFLFVSFLGGFFCVVVCVFVCFFFWACSALLFLSFFLSWSWRLAVGHWRSFRFFFLGGAFSGLFFLRCKESKQRKMN